MYLVKLLQPSEWDYHDELAKCQTITSEHPTFRMQLQPLPLSDFLPGPRQLPRSNLPTRRPRPYPSQSPLEVIVLKWEVAICSYCSSLFNFPSIFLFQVSLETSPRLGV